MTIKIEYENFRITDDEYMPIEFFDKHIEAQHIGTRKFRIVIETSSRFIEVCTIRLNKLIDDTYSDSDIEDTKINFFLEQLDNDLNAILNNMDAINKALVILDEHTDYNITL